MDFNHSTQAKSWMFNETSLYECRQQAAIVQSSGTSASAQPRVRKFASGFLRRGQKKTTEPNSRSTTPPRLNTPSNPISPVLARPCVMSSTDQETLVQFHAHQIQRLVGPSAIFPDLERSASVLSTAIMLFRRFYLSNSVIDFHPRSIAAASAFLAVKVDCERKLEIGLLAHATTVIYQKAQRAPLCKDELRSLTIEEIEDAERLLLEGVNYELRCHHPYGAIRVLANDVASVIFPSGDKDAHGYSSPRGAQEFYRQDPKVKLYERALAVAQSALVYSDVCFLFPPGKIAFAAVAIALEDHSSSQRLGLAMRRYLRMRFTQKTEDELREFEKDVTCIISNLARCRSFDLNKFSSNIYRCSRHKARTRAAEVNRVFAVASRIRSGRPIESSVSLMENERSRKRKRVDPGVLLPLLDHKIAKVTPIKTPQI